MLFTWAITGGPWRYCFDLLNMSGLLVDPTEAACVLQEYTCLTQKPDCPPPVWVFLACVFFFLGLYREAEEAASKGTGFFLSRHSELANAHLR